MSRKSLFKNVYGFRQSLKGSGGMYVILILGLVSGLSFLLTGGLTPNIERTPENPQFVEIEDQLSPIAQQNLQMQNIKVKPTATPTPTPSNTPTPSTTPTPSPTLAPSITPTPTDPVVACLDRTAVALLIDLSASMNVPSSKLSALNSALNLLQSNLTDDTVVGAYAFGPYPNYNQSGGDVSFNFENNKGVKQILPFSKYSDNKSSIDSQLGGLTQGGVGGTYMRNGFRLMAQKVQAAKQTFPDYDFVTILLSDGVPELGDDDPVVQDYWSRGLGFPTVTCAGSTCFAKHQDPRAWSDIGTNNVITPLRNQSKDQIIYTIALYGTTFPDTQLKSYLEDLLVDVAGSSNTPNYQYINSTNYSQLSTFFTRILDASCQ